MSDFFSISLLLAIGLVVGWVIGAARIHWPLVNYYRDYYQRKAEAQMQGHLNFLLAMINLHGAARSHRSAVPGATRGAGGLRITFGDSHHSSTRIAPRRSVKLYDIKKGGRDAEARKL